VPVVKLTKYLTIEPELHRKRGRAWAFTGAVTAALVLLIGIINFPVRVSAEGIVNPKDRAKIYARSGGFITDIRARDGQRLKKGDVILVAHSPELKAHVEQLRATVAAAESRRRGAAVSDNPAQAQSYEQDLKAYRDDLNLNLEKQRDLTIRSPIDGYLVAPDLPQLPGKYLAEGQEICTVQETDTLEIHGTIDQGDVQLISRKANADTKVRLVSRFDKAHELTASNLRIFSEASEQLPHEALGVLGGGTAPSDPRDESGKRATIPQFELRADVPNPDTEFVPGQRAYVKATVDKKPLMWHWYRDFMQVIQARSQSSKWK
jgi:putative peptide zinc metalloprotease protein